MSHEVSGHQSLVLAPHSSEAHAGEAGSLRPKWSFPLEGTMKVFERLGSLLDEVASTRKTPLPYL